MACVQGNLSCSSLSHASALECCYSNSSCPQPPFLRTTAGPKAPEEYQLSPVHWIGPSFPQGSLVPHAGVLGFFPVWKSKASSELVREKGAPVCIFTLWEGKLRVESGSSSRVERTHRNQIICLKNENRRKKRNTKGPRRKDAGLILSESAINDTMSSISKPHETKLPAAYRRLHTEWKREPEIPFPTFLPSSLISSCLSPLELSWHLFH